MSEQLHYDIGGPPIPAEALRTFATAALEATGVPSVDAEATAESLVHADLRGVHSHGIRLLGGYVPALEDGRLNPTPAIREVAGGPGHAVFDADLALGQISAHLAMRRAIEIAGRRGVGTTAVRNGGHFGAAAYWALMAADAGCVGHCTSNMAGALLLAFGGRAGASGNNPLSWAFPRREARPVVLDMACGVAALGKIQVSVRGGRRLPAGLAADGQGRPTRDATQVRYVLPAAGPKGYGLSLVHDIMSGVLSGGQATVQKPEFGPGLPYHGTHFFLVLDIDAIMPLEAFSAAMDAQAAAVTALQPAEGFQRVYMPGEIEWEAYARQLTDGVRFPTGVLDELTPLARRLDLPAPWHSA